MSNDYGLQRTVEQDSEVILSGLSIYSCEEDQELKSRSKESN
jgi:hypothetical protein